MQDMRMSTSRLLLIVLIYYVVTSIASLLIGLTQPALKIPDEVIELTQFGPTIGVLVVLLLFRGEKGIQLSRGLRFQSYILRRIVYLVVLTIAIFAIAGLCYQIYGIKIDFTNPKDLSNPFWLIIIAQFIGAAGEEFGWRFFLQPTLQKKLGVLPSSILVGLLWGIWHVGIFSEGLAFAALFILSAVSISVILGELLRNVRGNSLIIATAFHALTNLGMLLLFNEENGDVFAMGALSGAMFIAALIVVVLHNLFKSNVISQPNTREQARR